MEVNTDKLFWDKGNDFCRQKHLLLHFLEQKPSTLQPKTDLCDIF
jgi:hypothetical protein